MAIKTVRLTVRFSPDEARELAEAARDRGYANPSAFLRSAIRKELSQREGLSDTEQRITAGFERMSRDVFRVGRGQQALFAFFDTLAKTLLTCIPEPPADARRQAIALARERYEVLIRTATRAMEGDARAAMRDLVESGVGTDHNHET